MRLSSSRRRAGSRFGGQGTWKQQPCGGQLKLLKLHPVAVRLPAS